MLKIGLLITIAAIYGLNLLTIRDVPADAAGPDEQPSGKPIKISATAIFKEQFVNQSEDVPRVHAPTAIINAEGELHSYWYGGVSEGATDVAFARDDHVAAGAGVT